MRTGTAAVGARADLRFPGGARTERLTTDGSPDSPPNSCAYVWSGLTIYRELNLEGAKSALPSGRKFMKRASHMAHTKMPAVSMPAGIEQAVICADSGKLAGPQCINTRNEYFIAGSEPEKCDLHPADDPPTGSAAVVQ